MGLNEFAGYFAVAGSTLATGFIAAHYGLRPEPFYLGVVFVAFGLVLSALVVRETKHHVAANDGMAWGLFPLLFAAARMDLGQIGTLAAIYPATWGIAQLFTGAWSDRVGRKWLIASGMWIQAVGICFVVVSTGFATGAVNE